jgi:uncharacterized protein
MKSKILFETGERTFALIFDTGDDPVKLITEFANDYNLTAAYFTAIGTFKESYAGTF